MKLSQWFGLPARVARLEWQIQETSTFGMSKRLVGIVNGLGNLPERMLNVETFLDARSKGFTLFAGAINDAVRRIAAIEQRLAALEQEKK